ncbi:MAG: UbiD family decarboxylase [Chloroflexota bacterium]
MAYYQDLRQYLKTLDDAGLLVRLKRPINKDTELLPLVRLQFRGLPEKQRKAFIFDNVVDSKGKKYDIPVVVCALAASTRIYSLGLMCRPEEIPDKLVKAQANPIPPKMVKGGPVQEVVYQGAQLLERGGLEEFPAFISTPGYDCAPYITAPYWVTKDPENGIRNVGTYRAQYKSPTRLGINFSYLFQGAYVHWRKCKERGIPLQAAMVIGGPPSIGYVGVSRFPQNVDEFGVAGALAGEPLELVKCKTVDLEVPAQAEVVIEGELTTRELEPEAPFGESTGVVGLEEIWPYFTVKCITHRKDPIWLSFLSQYPPSESSKIRQHSNEGVVLRHLRDELKMPFVRQIAVHDPIGSNRYWVIRVAKTEPANVWRALEALGNRFQNAKVIVAVDEDINPEDPEAVNWAICHRMQPHRDVRIVTYTTASLMDPSIVSMEEQDRIKEGGMKDMPQTSRLMIDTTMKWAYPLISLPTKEYMDRAIQIWQEEGLPELELKEPVWGRNLGRWSKEDEQKAQWAVKGDYRKTGEAQAKRRRPA